MSAYDSHKFYIVYAQKRLNMRQVYAITAYATAYAKYVTAYVSHIYSSNCFKYACVTNATQYSEYLEQKGFEYFRYANAMRYIK